MTPALAIRNVSYSYAGKPALDRIGFEVARGRFTALLGPNGAGKTTLFSLICRLFKISDGSISIAGHDISEASVKALKHVGIVFQQPTLDLDLTVRQNLHYFAALRGISRTRASSRIAAELQRLDLSDSAGTTVRKLNGGHRRRVELARALLHEPDLLLLDEPTVGLDVPTRRHFVDYVHSLAADRKVAILWATHLIDEVDTGNDDLVVLNRGCMVAGAPAREVIESNPGLLLSDIYHNLTDSGAAR